MRRLAQRLTLTGSAVGGTAEVRAAFQVAEKLKPQLEMMMGNGGYRALLARALSLARVEVAWLDCVSAGDDAVLKLSSDLVMDIESEEFDHGRTILLAHLIGLLVALIGPSLTARIFGTIWPQVMLDSRDFGKGDQT